jgi:hypothetical protein
MAQQTIHNALKSIFSADFETLAEFYFIHDAEQVFRHLAANPRLIPLLQEAPARIQTIFGNDVPLHLQLAVDPEYSQDRELFVLLRLEPEAESSACEAEQKLHQLHNDWLITLPRTVTYGLNFDLE